MEPETQSAGTHGGGSARPPWWRIALVGRRPKRTAVRILVLAAACFLIRDFAVLPVRDVGISMLPAYRSNAVYFVNRLAYIFHGPRRGDVVAIRLLAGPHVMYMKRVVGLPGETVAFRDGKLSINGRVIDEPYVREPCDWDLPPEKIPLGQYYVVGDNRSMPAEDHTKGRVERRLILGKVFR